ncbi:MAG: UTP--glucose-1-phosphate uridylyltransferase, partial [Verrucomicrobiota bacterium]
SDAYQITLDWRLELRPELRGQPPIVDLDGEHYKMVDQLDAKLLGVPSLRDCRQLRVRGPVVFEPGVVLKGNVEVKTSDHQLRHLPGGVYENQTVLL